MWKDSYLVGVEFIDSQHKELFNATEELLRIVQIDDVDERKKESLHTVDFLKGYAASHFAEEEAYQLSVNYSDIDAHKTLHRIFVSTVTNLEKKMIAADFSVPVLKEIAGFLTSWLIYHIAGIDQKLKRRERLSEDKAAVITSYVDCFAKSAGEVLGTMAELATTSTVFTKYSGSPDDIRILIGLVGDNKGEAVFTFTRGLALRVIKMMTGMDITEVDEFVFSALCEISNIISGNASISIYMSGKEIDITPPKVISGFTGEDNRSGVYVDTECGRVAVSVSV